MAPRTLYQPRGSPASFEKRTQHHGLNPPTPIIIPGYPIDGDRELVEASTSVSGGFGRAHPSSRCCQMQCQTAPGPLSSRRASPPARAGLSDPSLRHPPASAPSISGQMTTAFPSGRLGATRYNPATTPSIPIPTTPFVPAPEPPSWSGTPHPRARKIEPGTMKHGNHSTSTASFSRLHGAPDVQRRYPLNLPDSAISMDYPLVSTAENTDGVERIASPAIIKQRGICAPDLKRVKPQDREDFMKRVHEICTRASCQSPELAKVISDIRKHVDVAFASAYYCHRNVGHPYRDVWIDREIYATIDSLYRSLAYSDGEYLSL